MSTDNHKTGRLLTYRSIAATLSSLGLEPMATGAAEFSFSFEDNSYTLFCSHIPELYLRRHISLQENDYDMEAVIRSVNMINTRTCLVKASFAGEEKILFQLGWSAPRYLDFKETIIPMLMRLDDAITSFEMGKDTFHDFNIDRMAEYLSVILDPENLMLNQLKN